MAHPGDDLQTLVNAARTTEDKTVIFAPGDYLLVAPLKLDRSHAGIRLVAAERGRACLRGDIRLVDWRDDDDGLVAADVPGVREGRFDTRTLIVNGRFAPRAELPGRGGRLKMRNDPKNLEMRAPSEGLWSRPIAESEVRALEYDPRDFPHGLDARNAELLIYHVWSASLCRVASNVVAESRLWLDRRLPDVLGFWNRRDYVVYNTRDGLREPGQWYLDRTRGKVVYRPQPGETMAKLDVRVPLLEQLVVGDGVEDLTLDGLVFTGTTMPLQAAGFAGLQLPAAVAFTGNSSRMRCEGLCFHHVGGTGFSAYAPGGRFACGRFEDIGGVAVQFKGSEIEFVSNRIVRIGRATATACGASVWGYRAHVWNNTLTDGPYLGFQVGGPSAVYEGNYVARVMQELSDGAAFYGSLDHSVFRNNRVEHLHTVKGGYGGHAFYSDNGSIGNLYENNITIDVPRPVHMNMGRGHVIRNNFFQTDGDLRISFSKSLDCSYYGNRLCHSGRVYYSGWESSVTNWHDNVSYGTDGYRDEPWPGKTPWPTKDALSVPAAAPGVRVEIDRDEDGSYRGGSPKSGDLWWSPDGLHLRLAVVHFRDEKFVSGRVWGQVDGVRITVNGRAFDFFADKIESMSGFKGFRVTADLPWKEIGLDPAPGLKVPFQMESYLAVRGEHYYFDNPGRPVNIVLK